MNSRSLLRPAFGLLLIAHALAHFRLSLADSTDPVTMANDAVAIALFSVAVFGFVIAGLAMLGVRVLETPSRPLLVLASAYSLVAIYVMSGEGVAWGVTLDVALFVIGVTGIYLRLPRPLQRVAV
jgi:hypothetical protein